MKELPQTKPAATERKKRLGSKSKIPSILKALHKDVSQVSMAGLNSDQKTSVDFVVSARGLSQVYRGQSKHNIAEQNDRRLPNIRLEKYSVRSNEFLKVDDDANSGRFVAFNLPKHATKANLEQTRVISDFGAGGARGASLGTQPLYNCHHYVHEVKYGAVRGKKEEGGPLVPFDQAAAFNKTMNYATSRQAHQQVASPRHGPPLDKQLGAEAENTVLILQKEGFPYDKYQASFQSNFKEQLQVIKEKEVQARIG